MTNNVSHWVTCLLRLSMRALCCESAGVSRMAAVIPLDEARRLDAELVRIGRGASAMRLLVGEALAALSAAGGHHELGFSSFEAYARERCERTGRWAVDTRWLAQRLRALPRLREALRAGVLGWSTAELLVRHVSVHSEAEWLERARKTTVRELRALLALHPTAAEEEDEENDPNCALKVTVPREDGWLFECTRKVLENVTGPMSGDEMLQTLLSEGFSTLLELAPNDARSDLYELGRLERQTGEESERRAAWREELRTRREAAEDRCSVGCPSAEAQGEGRRALEARSAEALDREIRRLCAELAGRDLALGVLAERARKAEVWRRLGFVSEAHYARERVGVSLSSLKAKRILAARAERLPEIASALSTGRIGYEAAYLLSRVATPATVNEWVSRAEQRTVKHLREEVEAAELLIRAGDGREQQPLDRDVGVARLHRELLGLVEQAGNLGRHVHLPGARPFHLGQLGELGFDPGERTLGVAACRPDQAGAQALPVLEQNLQKVLWRQALMAAARSQAA